MTHRRLQHRRLKEIPFYFSLSQVIFGLLTLFSSPPYELPIDYLPGGGDGENKIANESKKKKKNSPMSTTPIMDFINGSDN
jgi:hypothetical protein